MLIALDIGNTHTVAGIFEEHRFLLEERVPTSDLKGSVHIWQLISRVLQAGGLAPTAVTGVGVSSVVPALSDLVEDAVRHHLRMHPLHISGSLDFGMPVMYDDPSQIGPDRLCGAVAGFEKYGGPLIVIDFGTATTFDVVSRDGTFLGGIIAIGMKSAAEALHHRTAQLPEVALRFPAQLIGRDTMSALQSGIMYGAVDAVEGMVRRIRTELGQEVRVIATGGLSGMIQGHSEIISAYEPHLVLEGIRIICDRVRGR